MVYHFILYIETTRLGGIWGRPKLGFFDSLGPGSVNLFFMTTGFVFYPQILKGVGGANWRAIYVSRVFRIVPLVLFSLAAVSLVILVRLDFRPSAPASQTLFSMFRWISCWDQPDLFGYQNSSQLNAAVLWSLWFEWLFYLFVLPLCAVAMSLRAGRLPSWIVPAGLILVSLLLRPLNLTPLMLYLPLFGAGMLAFEIKERPEIAARLRGPVATIMASTLLVAGAALFQGPLRLLCHGLFFIFVACGCSLGGALRTRGARVLGELSYGIYLLHGLILNILFVDLASLFAGLSTEALPTLMPAAAIVAVLCTSVTFLTIERPRIRLGKSIAQRWTARRLRTLEPMLDVAP